MLPRISTFLCEGVRSLCFEVHRYYASSHSDLVLLLYVGQGQCRSEQPSTPHLPHANGQVSLGKLDVVPRKIRAYLDLQE